MDNSISLLGNVYFVHKNIFKDEKLILFLAFIILSNLQAQDRLSW
jgi:hypothetical protein